ncbi:26S proteasome non-ATPase regulatory subunit 5 [Leptopilina heterotoma]|uniref:26S proteasome non-ATPase regulatory subunit 5 n=1 Tax=Leptopilina heterotoma TaxID=63436 RepID=UPI001CA95FA8|nr:26S proteasome non-ATPase regulatory subunit 5 [Leptopilina heterotoma]
MTDWFVAKINCLIKLNNVEEKKELLAEIKIKLLGLTNNDLESVSRNLDLGKVFSQLTFQDREFLEMLCEVLKIIITKLDIGSVHQRYRREMFQLMSHSNGSVKNLILDELLRTASNSSALQQLLVDNELLVAVTEKVADDDLSVAQNAMTILKKIGETADGLKVLYSNILLRTIAKLLTKNDIITFRVYEIVVDIAKKSKIGLEASIQSGFLQSLIRVLDNDDELIQLNALEAMTDLALNEDGLKFLEEQEILAKLASKIAHSNETPLSNLFIPGLMKFFGHVSRFRPNEIFSKYPIVITALFDVIENGDESILAAALDTLGHISTTIEGKYALQDLGDSMTRALKKIAEIIKKMPTYFRLRALNNLEIILSVKKSEQDNRICSLTKSWFDSLDEEPLKLLTELCKQPFADIRQASLQILSVVASQVWGQEYIASHPGLVEFLLDRNIESFKECKEAKFEIVKNLSKSVDNIFDANTMQKFNHYVNNGPFYVETYTEVAIEGAS